MGRGFGPFLTAMEKQDPLAKALADYILRHDVAISTVARETGASRTTIYNWLAGDKISRVYRGIVEKLIEHPPVRG